MIIKNIHIDGFGAVRDRDFTFDGGLNIICGENESGKTTAAEFIRAMFYGLDSRSRSIRENERRRYFPADGGVMGGRMEIEDNGKTYVISRTFGKTAASDKLSVTDKVTGRQEDIDPASFVGLTEESYLKTLYIKQMSTAVSDSKNDEIRQRLINLCQTGEENMSYQSAAAKLDEAYKQLASRTKGVIPALNARLSQLHEEYGRACGAEQERKRLEQMYEQAVKNRDSVLSAPSEESREGEYYEKYEQWRSARAKEEEEGRQEHEEIYERVKKESGASVRWAVINAFICLAGIALLGYFVYRGFSFYAPLLLAAAFGAICIKNLIQLRQMREYLRENKQYTCNNYENDVKYREWFLQELGSESFDDIPHLIKQYGDGLRERAGKAGNRAAQAAEQVKDIENRIARLDVRPAPAVKQDIADCEEKIRSYEKKLEAVVKAREALEKAFRETEQNFAPLITREASPVLEYVTGGEYTRLVADNIYTLSAVNKDGKLISSDYLSTGCFDQIYFSLRIGIIKLMAADKPVVFDDAFAYYDDERLKNALGVLKKLPNQIILFSCRTQELNFNKE